MTSFARAGWEKEAGSHTRWQLFRPELWADGCSNRETNLRGLEPQSLGVRGVEKPQNGWWCIYPHRNSTRESLGVGKSKLGPTWCRGPEEVLCARVPQSRAFRSFSHTGLISRHPELRAFWESLWGSHRQKDREREKPITESISKETRWRNLPPFGRPGEADLSSSFGEGADLGFLD